MYASSKWLNELLQRFFFFFFFFFRGILEQNRILRDTTKLATYNSIILIFRRTLICENYLFPKHNKVRKNIVSIERKSVLKWLHTKLNS